MQGSKVRSERNCPWSRKGQPPPRRGSAQAIIIRPAMGFTGSGGAAWSSTEPLYSDPEPLSNSEPLPSLEDDSASHLSRTDCHKSQLRMPTSRPPTARAISRQGFAPRTTNIGPGHMPQVPQPSPKISGPNTTSRSNSFFRLGKPTLPCSIVCGASLRSKAMKNGMVMHRAEPITKARLGSQAPEPKSRNEATLLGRTMVQIVRPMPKQKPTASSNKLRSLTDAPCFFLPLDMSTTSVVSAKSARATPAAINGCVSLLGTGATSGITDAVPINVAANMAEPMKVGTATQERAVQRARPVRPCPEVQPLPIAVPKPTSTPPMPYRNSNSKRSSEVGEIGNGSKPP
mmetsp:Transcript_18394/g.52739  ORF Transcript_18394/g.52739 Transcript_18394/m.52739 type:complete len:344 (+) Transcript_18394:89-1120(+)